MLASVASASSTGRPAAPEPEQPQEFMSMPRPPRQVGIAVHPGEDTAPEEPKRKLRRRKRRVSVFEASRCDFGAWKTG